MKIMLDEGAKMPTRAHEFDAGLDLYAPKTISIPGCKYTAPICNCGYGMVGVGQRVIDTGLYGVVRHPMYSATLLMFLSMPLMLGSAVSLCFFLPYPLVIAGRIRDEEALLEDELEGYREYKQKVKYRLVPFIW